MPLLLRTERSSEECGNPWNTRFCRNMICSPWVSMVGKVCYIEPFVYRVDGESFLPSPENLWGDWPSESLQVLQASSGTGSGMVRSYLSKPSHHIWINHPIWGLSHICFQLWSIWISNMIYMFHISHIYPKYDINIMLPYISHISNIPYDQVIPFEVSRFPFCFKGVPHSIVHGWPCDLELVARVQ